jgi:hypothetical protein
LLREARVFRRIGGILTLLCIPLPKPFAREIRSLRSQDRFFRDFGGYLSCDDHPHPHGRTNNCNKMEGQKHRRKKIKNG